MTDRRQLLIGAGAASLAAPSQPAAKQNPTNAPQWSEQPNTDYPDDDGATLVRPSAPEPPAPPPSWLFIKARAKACSRRESERASRRSVRSPAIPGLKIKFTVASPTATVATSVVSRHCCLPIPRRHRAIRRSSRTSTRSTTAPRVISPGAGSTRTSRSRPPSAGATRTTSSPRASAARTRSTLSRQPSTRCSHCAVRKMSPRRVG